MKESGVMRKGELVADDDPILSVPEASQFLRVSRNTVYELIHAGELPAFRLRKGGHWRLTRGELEEWLEKRREQGAG